MTAATAALATVAVLWIPGAILRRLLSDSTTDPIAAIGTEIAFGVAFWPLLFLATTASGFIWNPVAARSALGLLAVLLAALIWKQRPIVHRPDATTAFALVMAGVVAYTRISQVEGIAYPLWVDSVHHTMIVRLLTSAGRLPTSYEPFIPGSTFYYHWGFHAVVAFVAWITGLTSGDGVARLLLIVGQVLNVLIFFAVYSGAKALLRSRSAALLSATLATLVSFFPAYYVSWGRYTQLCGLLVLPPLSAAFWRLGRHPRVKHGLVVAILGGGLLLVHVRVAIVFAMLASVLSILLLIQRRWHGLAFCGAAALAAFVLASPWLLRLAALPQVRTLLAPSAAERGRWETPNMVPDDLLWAPNNAPLFALATGGLIALTPVHHLRLGWRIAAIALWLALVVLLERHSRKKRRARPRFDSWRVAILVAWVVVTAAIINSDRFGLPRFTPLPNSAAVIMLFLPASAAGACIVRWACTQLFKPAAARLVIVATALLIGGIGASTMLHIINPRTLLVTQADRQALLWISRHTPRTAKFAVGVQPWLGGSFIGIDGGYWIPLVADRRSILPPGLYPWVMPPAEVEQVTRVLAQWDQIEQSGTTAVGDFLRANGLTHVYFGPRNETSARERAAADPSLVRIYDADGVDIYALAR